MLLRKNTILKYSFNSDVNKVFASFIKKSMIPSCVFREPGVRPMRLLTELLIPLITESPQLLTGSHPS